MWCVVEVIGHSEKTEEHLRLTKEVKDCGACMKLVRTLQAVRTFGQKCVERRG